MQSLRDYFSENKSSDIHTIGRYIERHINENWDTLFRSIRQDVIDLYDKIGDAAYGLYGRELFKPIYAQFKDVGLQTKPRLPFGGFSSSREWGPEDNRQRWFWSNISTADGTALGTIALGFFHNHIEIGIPAAPQIVALEETTRGGVVNALSSLQPGFGTALEARAEYAEYFK